MLPAINLVLVTSLRWVVYPRQWMAHAHFRNVLKTIPCPTLIPYPCFRNGKAVWIWSKNCAFPGLHCLQYLSLPVWKYEGRWPRRSHLVQWCDDKWTPGTKCRRFDFYSFYLWTVACAHNLPNTSLLSQHGIYNQPMNHISLRKAGL